MSTDITLSSAVRSNLLSLQKTADLLGKTQEKLATGLKVNSALDDPTAFFTASALNSRASDLNRLQDFVGNAIQTLRAADEGITAITNLVEAAEATARQALQTAGSTSTAVSVTGSNTVTADTAPTVTGTSIGSDAELDATGLTFDNTDTIEINLNGTTSIINFENNGNGIDASAASGNNYYINLDDADGATGAAATVTGADIGANQLLGTNLSFTANETVEITIDGVTSIIHFESAGNGIDATADAGNDYYINLDDADGATGAAASTQGADVGGSHELEGDLGLDVNDTYEITIDGVTSVIHFEKNGNGVDATADAGNDYYINLDDADGATGAAPTITGAGLAGDQTLKTQLGYAAGDTISISNNGTTYTINFEEAGAGTNTTGTDGTPPNNFYINLDDYDGAGGGVGETTVSQLAATIDSIAGISSSFSVGNELTIASDANQGDLTISVVDADGGGDAADELLFDALGFTTNVDGDLTVEPGSSGNATLSTLAAKINAITNLSSSVTGNQITIASDTNLGDLTITGVDNGTDSDAVLGAIGYTNSGTTGIHVAIPGSSTDASLTTLAAKINSIANLSSSVAGNQITIASDSNLGDLTITTRTSGNASDTPLNALGFTNSGSTGITVVAPGSSGDATASTLAALINSITGLDASFASNQLTIASASHVGDLTITVRDSGTANDTKLNALGLTNSGTTGITVVEPGNVDLSALSGNLTLQIGTGTANTITFGTDDGANEVSTRTELLAAINAITGISASFTADALELDLTDATETLTIGGGAPELAALHLTAGTNYAAVATTVAERTNFADQFDELRSQIDQLAKDAGYNGVNLLDGDSLTVTFNEDGTSSLGVSGVTFNSSGLGITAAENNFQLDSNINAAITNLKGATDTLRAQASKFGSNLSVVETRQDFTKELINVLETGAANLTLADTNEEGANLLALQTRQQLSSTALSLASQADQNVLRLF